MERAIDELILKYPQLMLDIFDGASTTEQYKNVVLKGMKVQVEKNPFVYSKGDSFSLEDTPAGKANIAYIENRNDFERIIRVLAFKCEPVQIASNTGAITIRGIINYSKIRKHKFKYLLSGKNDWDEEYKRFISNPENYKDTLIVLSQGKYSGIDCKETEYTENEWIYKSFVIRKFHELSHFVSGRIYVENRETVRDETIADCIGLIAATGKYDLRLAKKFLGIGENGRLNNYVSDSQLARAEIRSSRIIEILEKEFFNNPLPPFEFLQYLEKNKIGIL